MFGSLSLAHDIQQLHASVNGPFVYYPHPSSSTTNNLPWHAQLSTHEISDIKHDDVSLSGQVCDVNGEYYVRGYTTTPTEVRSIQAKHPA